MVENVIGPSTTWFTSGGDVGEQWLSERVIIWAVRKKDGKMKRMRELTRMTPEYVAVLTATGESETLEFSATAGTCCEVA